MTEISIDWFNSTVGNNGSSSGAAGGGGSGAAGVQGQSGASQKVVPVVNQPFQALLLTLILISAILTNGSVILNISRDSLKLRMVHFLLIRHVCITDSVGAIFVLPVPLISFIKGYWIWGETACTVISTTTACCWTMHLVAVALYRADRVFAVWLPTGRYPVVGARVVNGLLVLIWATALSGSYLATYTFTPTFQPALALCIPNVPLIFFILVFSSYILGLIILTTGYIFAFVTRRRKKRKRRKLEQQQHHHQNPPVPMPRHHHHHTSSNNPNDSSNSNSKSAPQLASNSTPCHSSSVNTDWCNNKLQQFNDSSTTITPSTSEQSCVRPLTPPPPVKPGGYKTHRRSHSDNVRVNQIVISNESVASVQYRTLCKGPHEDLSSDEYMNGVDESVAEKLDECEEEPSAVDGVSGGCEGNAATGQYDCGGGVVGGGGGTDPTGVSTHVVHKRSARCRVFASYAVSIGHLILYLPAMLVVGLLGAKLPPGVAFLCGTVVYCEFIVQPIALLLVSPKLRGEVVVMVKGFFKRGSNNNNNNNNRGTEGGGAAAAAGGSVGGGDRVSASGRESTTGQS